jgi:hypothetical protein
MILSGLARTKVRGGLGRYVAITLVLIAPGALNAQQSVTSAVVRDIPTKEQMDAAVVPDLSFTDTPEVRHDFQKFFFWHRPNTDFATAYRDIRECDDFARGISFHTANIQVPYPYTGTLAGGVGAAIGDAVADAIYGSAQRRLTRRINLRTCMGYKEYDRYGLPKDVWEKFNFEEGNRTVKEEERVIYLAQQAKVASGPKPTQGELPR